MKLGNLTAVLTALAISAGAHASIARAQEARPIIDEYSVNVNGNLEGFLAAVKKVFDKATELGIKSHRGVYVAEISGPGTNKVFVTVQHPNYAAMEAANAKIFATEEWATFQKATADMGMTTTSRQVLRELYAD
jgi:hypothetical protein